MTRVGEMNLAYGSFLAFAALMVLLGLLFDINIFGWQAETMAGYGFLIYWPLIFLCLLVALGPPGRHSRRRRRPN
jgi:hypothetical protein